MPERPLLFFPEAVPGERRNRGGGGGNVAKPTAAQQRQRLDARFQQIAQSFRAVQPTVQGLAPEEVIVLETLGDKVDGLADAAARIPGLEWMAELDLDDLARMGDFVDQDDPQRLLPCRLYAVMSNQQAMDRLIALWDSWCSNPSKRAARGFGPFKDLFTNLRDIRRWDVSDRIDATRVRQYLEELLSHATGDIRFEVELWCRQEAAARERAYESLARLVREADGRCVSQCSVPSILYHGVLVAMSAPLVREMVDRIVGQDYTQLLRCQEVMFFRPFGQARFGAQEGDEPPLDMRARFAAKPPPVGDPLVALLDGLPMEQHAALRQRLVIDDPDSHGERYQAAEQLHGTAMASLLLHGDLHEEGEALARPVYVRPILVPVRDLAGRVHETTPDDSLLVDLLHRAVRRIVEGDGGQAAVAPTVRIVNLSFGNSFQPFDRELSPLARLLDWFAWKHKLLFVVSAGNQSEPITLEVTSAAWQLLDEKEMISQTLRAMHASQFTRRLFSPAESVNSITVGALHADASRPPSGDRRVDLLRSARLPSPIATVASGFRRAVKPEVLLPGGRQYYLERHANSADPASFEVAEAVVPPGHLTAAPAGRPLQLDNTIHCRGTSNAAALASRCAAQVLEQLDAKRDQPGADRLTHDDLGVLAKCLLVHGADWGGMDRQIERVFEEQVRQSVGNDPKLVWRPMDSLKARFLGYGEVQSDRALFCNDERVTMVGWGHLASDGGHRYDVPLPPALLASRVQRRLTITLAWFTPINLRHRNYRQADLWVHLPESVLGTHSAGLDANATSRGTVQHRVFEGNRVLAFDDGGTLPVQVSCREDAGKLTDAVPYALAVTLEVAEPLGVSIYDEIRDRIRPRVQIDVGAE
ncbi:MAG TPA: S8 family peptidase [Pirellulales bacterium]|nr:S8 family peptidase [Pirellulales bacterium]